MSLTQLILVLCWVTILILKQRQLRTTRTDPTLELSKEKHTASFSHSGVSSDHDSRLSVEVWGWQLLSLALMHWLKSQQGCYCLCVCSTLSHSDKRQNKSQRDTESYLQFLTELINHWKVRVQHIVYIDMFFIHHLIMYLKYYCARTQWSHCTPNSLSLYSISSCKVHYVQPVENNNNNKNLTFTERQVLWETKNVFFMASLQNPTFGTFIFKCKVLVK